MAATEQKTAEQETAEQETAEEFEARFGSIVAASFTGFGVALGIDLGLFDDLGDVEEPKTSQEIADSREMKERYVREWLGVMVTGGIVELDSTGEKYFLPSCRAPLLKQNGPNHNTSWVTLFLPYFGGDVYKKIKECFSINGPTGLSYSEYPHISDIISKITGPYLKNHLTKTFIPEYPELKKKLDRGITVADIGCGKGVSTLEFADAFPNSTFYGVDFLQDVVDSAQASADERSLANCKFVAADAAELPVDWDRKFDYVFMHDSLHDQAYPDTVLGEVHRILSPGGIYTLLDVNCHTKVKDNRDKMPGSQVIYMISLMHCMPVSLYFEGGMGLGAAWGREKAVEMLTTANFEVCHSAQNTQGIGWHYYCKKK